MKLTPNEESVLELASRYPNWHYFTCEPETRQAVKSLYMKGLIETIDFNQFKKKEPSND